MPLPVPLPPLLSEIQLTLLAALQTHVFALALTATVPLIPAAGADAPAGLSEKVQGATAAWLMVKVALPVELLTVMVPVRAGPELTATE